jgi:chromosome segregation ATPase
MCSVSSGDVARLQAELAQLSQKNRSLKDELQDAHAQVAKLSAVAASGSDREKSQAAHEAALATQQEQLRCVRRLAICLLVVLKWG